MAPMEQQPAIATLLLQLDLMMTGFDKPYNNLMKAERTNKFDNDYVETMMHIQDMGKLKKYSPMISDVLKSLINSSFVDVSRVVELE
ncbi:hypothetical protein LINPERPRIM_LOCUS37136 [Linum perenne]